MNRTKLLRGQHDAAIALIAQIDIELAKREPDSFNLATSLAKLTGLLRIHLAQEDKSLYPFMQSSLYMQAARKASDFQKEMGRLGPDFLAFAARWASPVTIASSLPLFRTESRSIFLLLGNRIKRENEELYPLAESITYDQIARTA